MRSRFYITINYSSGREGKGRSWEWWEGEGRGRNGKGSKREKGKEGKDRGEEKEKDSKGVPANKNLRLHPWAEGTHVLLEHSLVHYTPMYATKKCSITTADRLPQVRSIILRVFRDNDKV